MFSVARSLFARKVALLALIVVLVGLFGGVARAQDTVTIDLPPEGETSISYVSDSQERCARGQFPHPWTFHVNGARWWLHYSWSAIEAGCAMELQLQSSDTDIFRFITVEYTPNTVNCEGSTQRRVVCTLPGASGPARLAIRMEMTGRGFGTLAAFDRSSGLNRLYDIIVAPDFYNLAPFMVR